MLIHPPYFKPALRRGTKSSTTYNVQTTEAWKKRQKQRRIAYSIQKQTSEKWTNWNFILNYYTPTLLALPRSRPLFGEAPCFDHVWVQGSRPFFFPIRARPRSLSPQASPSHLRESINSPVPSGPSPSPPRSNHPYSDDESHTATSSLGC